MDRQPKHIFGIAIDKKAIGQKHIWQKFYLATSNAWQADLNLVVPEHMNITDGDLVEAVLQSNRGRFIKSAQVAILATAPNQARLARWHSPNLALDMNFLKQHFERQNR